MRRKRYIPNAVRQEVCRRAGAKVGTTFAVQCAYCEYESVILWPIEWQTRPVPQGLLEFDHVIPEVHGGPTTADNIVLACRPCNRAKGAKVA